MKLIKHLNKLFNLWPKIILIFSLVLLVYIFFLIWQIYQTVNQTDFDQSRVDKIEIKRDLWDKVMNEIEGRPGRLQKAIDKTYKNPF